MFNKEHKLLQELQNIQTLIEECNIIISKLKAPQIDYQMHKDLMMYFEYTLKGLFTDCGWILQRSDGNTLDYLEQLGNYLINFAKYEKEKQLYKDEIKQLQAEERRIKEKLGIK